MLSVLILVLILSSKGGNCLNTSGKSYYFKTNGNNEFRVYNRIHFLNHNITDLDYNYNRKVENIQVMKADEKPRAVPKNFYLDEEWNYEHKSHNKSEIPRFIQRLYDSRKDKPANLDTVRILFNDNRNKSTSIIRMNLQSLKKDENITDADLYFYWPLQNTSKIYKTSVVLRLYQIEFPSSGNFTEKNLIENPDIHKLFNVIYISKATAGWQTFKIKKPIDNWMHKDEQNLGLLLTISSFDHNKLISIYNDTNEGMLRTFAILTINKNNTSTYQNTTTSKNITDPTSISALRHCHRRHWFVSFQRLYWTNLIIAPFDGFTAYDCTGRCSSPDQDNLENHVKLVNIFGMRSSCCVPSEFLPLPLMFYDRFDNIVFKSYEKMIVIKCTCR